MTTICGKINKNELYFVKHISWDKTKHKNEK